MAEHHALQQLLVAGFRKRPADIECETPLVVVAEESRQLDRRRLAAFVERVLAEEVAPDLGRRVAGDRAQRALLEGEVEHRWKLVAASMLGELARLEVVVG